MRAVVFCGPSLPHDLAPAVPGLEYRAPARQGDVHRVVCQGAAVVGVVDGYFESVPSVWHKEVLHAMHEGVHVLGAASIGALRAAELDRFGMVGVGFVYELFRDGLLEDDDEVAVLHGPHVAESGVPGYRPITEAMVNIRATLSDAVAEGVIDDALAGALCDYAKALNYKERTYARLLARVRADGARAASLARFEAWLPANRVDQKHRDALELVETVRGLLAAGPPAKRVEYHFDRTFKWEGLVRRDAGADGDTPLEDPQETDLVLDEVGLDPHDDGDALLAASLGAAADVHARECAYRPGEEARRSAEREVLRRAGIRDEVGRDAWLRANELRPERFRALVEARARRAWTLRRVARETRAWLVDELRLSGRFPALLARARDKRRVLAAHGLDAPAPLDPGPDETQLVEWLFRERLGRAVPADLDAFAASRGFASRSAFLRAARREYLYRDRDAG